MPKVWNKRDKDCPNTAIYVGRPSIFGNPYQVFSKTERGTAVEKYRIYLMKNPLLLERVKVLRGKDLVCWCKPEKCHGDVLLEIANAEEAIS